MIAAQHTLLAMTIGPVQDFIATARKCQDLWAGSWLLSELAKAAADAVQAGAGGVEVLVFPGATAARALAAGSDSSVANKLLARIPGGPNEARTAAHAARRGWESRLHAIARTTFQKVGASDRDRSIHFHEARALDQVAELIEFCWVAVPEKEGYAATRRSAERLLMARKTTRIWGQPTWSAPVPKSSMDGSRESVLDERLFGPRAALGAEELRRHYRVHPSERLCGVALLKRMISQEAGLRRFHSTSHVAARPWTLSVGADPAMREPVESFLGVLRDTFSERAEELDSAPVSMGALGRLDGQALFVSRLLEEYDDVVGASAEAEADRRGLQQALERLLRAAGRGEVLPYYGVLLADGDHMGRLIDGIESPGDHRRLSIALDGFARQAGDLVEGHHGSLVYSGGDDVLALVPLHSILACADALRRAFATAVSDCTPGDAAATLSVGIGIHHHIEPMELGFATARAAERLAKSTRNALAVVHQPRGGSPVEVVGSWDPGPGDIPPLHRRLREFVSMHCDGSVSERTGFELAALAVLDDGSTGAPPPAFFRAECERILGAKRRSGGDAMADDARARLAFLMGDDPAALGRELVVSRVLARAALQAPPEEAVA